ncbi:acyltransferase family protein [Allohahella sp. A8]|uniref:acyltransferase family protein n=1 Tax=Allohahella sp. A8 TaxID=3141461 RepID=UPI003A804F67
MTAQVAHHTNLDDRISIWDGWRGMAILLVLIDHFANIPFLKEGRMGVDVFFVLSGMLMSKILFEKRTSLSTFYIRRFSRIIPLYWLFLLVLFSGAAIAGLPFTFGEVVANVFFLRTYLPGEPHIWSSSLPAEHLWSLNVEEHAYVLMSLVTLMLTGLLKPALALLGLAGLSLLAVLGFYFGTDYPKEIYFIRTETAVCFVFISAAYNLLKAHYGIRVNPMVPVVTLLLAFACYSMEIPKLFRLVLAPFLLAFTINHLQEITPIARRLLTFGWLRYLGLWSFSIYIWQQPFYIYRDSIPLPDPLIALLTIAVGMASYYWYEQPVRSWINAHYARKQSALPKDEYFRKTASDRTPELKP